MKSVSISVIIPAFNVENTIGRCLESILGQTFQDFEIIVVDDGSTDKTASICDDYAHRDKRVIVYHQENQGTSTARKRGEDLATGTYIIYVDADDWMDSRMLEDLHENTIETDADIVCCDYICEYSDRQEQCSISPVYENGREELNHIFQRGGINCVLWNKLIRASLVKDIMIPDGLRWGEDLLLLAQLLQKCRRVSYVTKALYHYDLHSSDHSSVRNKDANHIFTTRTALIRHLHKILSPKPEAWWRFATGMLFEVLLIDTDSHQEKWLRDLLHPMMAKDGLRLLLQNPKRTIVLLIAAYTPIPHYLIRKLIRSIQRI